jgi:hypothetical protein
MRNKKLYFILGIAVLVVAAAAFVAGRLINGGVSPLGLFGLAEEGDGITILPAEELPKTEPEVSGVFVERQDNIIFVETDPPHAGSEVSGSPVGIGGGQKFEVVVTTETIIYHETTKIPAERPTGDDPRVLQQTVVAGTLGDLIISQSLVRVWGRKSGDRIIAEVLMYLNL